VHIWLILISNNSIVIKVVERRVDFITRISEVPENIVGILVE
jgi:hypothetical protein